MRAGSNAKKYAKMFLNSLGMDVAQKAIAELAAIEELSTQSAEFRGLLLGPMFSNEEKEDMLATVGDKAGISPETVKFAGFLCRQGAAKDLGEVVSRAKALYAERMDIARATVITPVPVDAELEGRLKASLKALLKKDIEIDYETDPSLIGGMLVKVGSTMYDSSLAGQLRLLRTELLKG